MTKRRCPNCEEVCLIGSGVDIDDNGNIFCASCRKPMLGVTSLVESQIKKITDKNNYKDNAYGQHPIGAHPRSQLAHQTY